MKGFGKKRHFLLECFKTENLQLGQFAADPISFVIGRLSGCICSFFLSFFDTSKFSDISRQCSQCQQKVASFKRHKIQQRGFR